MTRTGHADARNYGDSPLMRVDVPITSAMFDSCLRITWAAKKAVCTINLRHSLRLPFGSTVESLATPSQARARDLAPTLCRALMVQTASLCRPYSPALFPDYSSA
jgi:hypothetical protein